MSSAGGEKDEGGGGGGVKSGGVYLSFKDLLLQRELRLPDAAHHGRCIGEDRLECGRDGVSRGARWRGGAKTFVWVSARTSARERAHCTTCALYT